jgi:hypothetical protein
MKLEDLVYVPEYRALLDVPGVSAYGVSDTCFVLSPYELILAFQDQKFFEVVTVLSPIQASTLKTLKVLHTKRIISEAGDVLRTRCTSCQKRSTVLALRSLLSNFQALVLEINRRGMLPELGKQLGSYFTAHELIKINIRTVDGSIREVILNVKRTCNVGSP